MSIINNNFNYFIDSHSSYNFRVISRKGHIRYIASNINGSLKSVIDFAPPTKKRARFILSLLSVIDFNIPFKKTLVRSCFLSDAFIDQVSELLNTDPKFIGIYIGEPGDNQKMIVLDISESSKSIIKIAIGDDANRAIEKEIKSVCLARESSYWEHLVPQIIELTSINGKKSIKIERIKGNPLKLIEFERLFFSKDSELRNRLYNDNDISIAQWLDNSHYMDNIKSNLFLTNLLQKDDIKKSLQLRSSLGLIHGDFAPWNVIQISNPLKSDVVSYKVIDWEFSNTNTPLLFDIAYAAWCYDKLLNRSSNYFSKKEWKQLVCLGRLWKELRTNIDDR